jgi:hypothetical protein
MMIRHIAMLSLVILLSPGAGRLLAQSAADVVTDNAQSDQQAITDAMADGTQGGRIIALHRSAVATMRKTCDDYRRIKALELSVTLNIPFREA